MDLSCDNCGSNLSYIGWLTTTEDGGSIVCPHCNRLNFFFKPTSKRLNSLRDIEPENWEQSLLTC